MSRNLVAIVASALAFALPSPAQRESKVAPPEGATGLELDPHVPIHAQADDPDGGPYGTWAAGAGFKVGFSARSVAFHPERGDGAAWRWSTERILVGDTELAGPRAEVETAFTPARFESRCDGIVEAYDLRNDGVEQSFIIQRRPVAAGPLLIVGRVDSPWSAPR